MLAVSAMPLTNVANGDVCCTLYAGFCARMLHSSVLPALGIPVITCIIIELLLVVNNFYCY